MTKLFPDEAPSDPEWFTAGKTTPATHIANVRRGRHPMGWPLLKQAAVTLTCGDCGNCFRKRYNVKVYIKCDLTVQSNGPGTDIRRKWAACDQWKQERVRDHEHDGH